MNAKELAAQLMEHPEADVRIMADDTTSTEIGKIEYFDETFFIYAL